MKSFLPNIKNSSSKGFTLIELMVTVAIIAIIATVAIALFTNAQASARNGKRLAELESLANALEQNKTNTGVSPGYQLFATTQFAGGVIPATDPQGYMYCIVANSAQANPATWTSGGCVAPFVQVSATVPAVGSASYKLCTSREAVGTTPASVFCRTNLQ